MNATETEQQIIKEIYTLLRLTTTEIVAAAAINSWKNTLTDENVLMILKHQNHRIQLENQNVVESKGF